MSANTKALTPRTARTTDEICELPRTMKDYAGHWILVDETTVTIVMQRAGEAATGTVKMPRRVFDSMVDFYNGVSRG